ncbi:hypothetical protein JYT74_03750 [Crocinitomix catalasitica]|nr:hypothetical protein [Crocinitomix catalasitica]
MKKLYLSICFLIACSVSIAQDSDSYPAATCSDEFCVQLDPDQAIQEHYKIDIAPFGFATNEAARAKFGYISNNLLTYTVDFDIQRVILTVHTDRTPVPHDITWWNDYIDSLCGL